MTKDKQQAKRNSLLAVPDHQITVLQLLVMSLETKFLKVSLKC